MTTYAADDADFIRKRMQEIKDEQAEAAKLRTVEFATGEMLNSVGQDWGLKREMSESDYTFRARIQTKKREHEAAAS